MLIGQLSKMSGFSKETIRYYQGLNLFEGMVKKDENGYRNFSNQVLEILKIIEKSKTYGFTLNEVNQFLQVKDSLPKKLALVEEGLTQRIEKHKAEIEHLTKLNENLLLLKKEVGYCKEHCLQNQSPE